MSPLGHGRLTTNHPKSARLELAKGLTLARGYKCVELHLLRENSSRDTRLRVAVGGTTLSASCITTAQQA